MSDDLPERRRRLSDAQRRMWFVQRLDPAEATLNVCAAYRFGGALATGRLRAALAAVATRHDVLRSTWHIDEFGEPYRMTHADGELHWQEHDLTGLPGSGRDRRVAVLARREFARPFDLAGEFALRVTLVRTGVDEHVLILTAHRIAWDEGSWPVFFTEVNAAYRGDHLPEPSARYHDLAVGTDPADEAADLEYWHRVLTPLPNRLELPGRPAAAGSGSTAQTVTRTVPDALLARIRAVGAGFSADVFTVLLAGFQALIQRYTAADDFLITVPVSNRPANPEQAPIGYFGNTVIVRATPERDATFTDYLESAVHACAGAFAHRGLGIDRVVRAVGPRRATGRDGLVELVQISFGQRAVAPGFELPGIDSAVLPFGSVVAQEELELTVVGDDAGATLEATYRIGNLDRDTVDQLLDHYLQLLDIVVDTPGRRLSEIDVLGADRGAVLDLSHGVLADPVGTTVVAQLEARVAATPHRIALVSDDGELGYAELNARANRLAHWLIGIGTGPEDIVALSVDTSVDFVIAAWAILKSGAAYLPIDPGYPAERIEYLLDDARPRLLLTAAVYAEGVAAAESESLPETNPVDRDRMAPLRPGNTAYVIYTSGSTGRPKGVAVAHAAIADHLSGFSAEWDLDADDRVLQSTSVSFDASLMDIFVTLFVGARVVIPKPDAHRDIAYVAELVSRHGVSVLHMVPSMLATFLMVPEINNWTTLRHMPVGGEALPGEVADRFTARFDAQLRNHYGPTEAVVCATHMPVAGPQGTGTVPIGVPNRNVFLYLLDDVLHLVPHGVVGEIYLGGDQLARGYLNRAGLTAERFVADPFRPGHRLYRTGDLGRRGADGVVEFIGRTDEQVKVRGYRIELGEVEAAMNNHPDVAHAVVVAVEHPVLGRILAAYPVPVPGAALDLDSLRERMAARLPEYMMPATFTTIERIPLTAHGKLDRYALPTPEFVAAREFREPQTPTERRLAELFGRLFDRDRIGADDSFFELGGHSLLVSRLLSMVRAEFGVEIDMRAPFRAPTVSGLAAHLAAKCLRDVGVDIDDRSRFPGTTVPTGSASV